ncbi:MAG: valine--tRNA ligase [Defluviitaleaceae bacterium]|nr:valine--tRNA ligase [Defluviitaleaceae bacterium]
MKKELAKNYDHTQVEDRIYAQWQKAGYFRAEVDPSRLPYTIVMPPPNVTGELHMGHALDATIQDILIRFKRMQGYSALWLPGIDHASISTEVKVVDKMREEENLSKEDVGREGFLERAWSWKHTYGDRILTQIRKFGSSCDWSRERFTMDEGLNRAVVEVFVRLYEKGLIYRGERLINWCPECQTTISDAEVEHKDNETYLYYMKYPVKDTGEYIHFATTRPETCFADVAVAVNPRDPRLAHLVGKTAVVPFVNREIPIIADEHVDIEFGVGALKITPGHSPADFDIGKRHGLPVINVMNDDGTLNANNAEFGGLDRFIAKDRIVEAFGKLGLFTKKERVTNAVGTHERCGKLVEPLIKLQWFVRMDELAKPAIHAHTSGELQVFPPRFGKVYMHWLENIRDWCISRQLWWGHRIPAYTCASCEHLVVARTTPASCPLCGHAELTQDEDCLDTWFSSALWPFSTLGWPDETEDLKYFYPTDTLVTSYDILFFWVVRMVFSGLEHMGELPFKHVIFHGLVRDSKGRKMSKTLGNGVDPLVLINEYGADVLRLTLMIGSSLEQDTRFDHKKVETNRTFLNKIWNATRFILMNIDGTAPDATVDISRLTAADKWILSRVNTLTEQVTDNLERYEFGLALQNIMDFIRDEFCDWYIEMVKPRLYNEDDPSRKVAVAALQAVMINSMKLLHPFMPFITEEVFQSLKSGTHAESIMICAWPVPQNNYSFPREEREVGLIKDAVKQIRALRLSKDVAPSKKVSVCVVAEKQEVRAVFENGLAFFTTLAGASGVHIRPDAEGIGGDAVSAVVEGAVIYIPLDELVDPEKEAARLEAERVKLTAEVARVDKMLSNERFLAGARPEVVRAEEAKRAKYSDMLSKVEEELAKACNR